MGAGRRKQFLIFGRLMGRPGGLEIGIRGGEYCQNYQPRHPLF
jgi:hypothetical protein